MWKYFGIAATMIAAMCGTPNGHVFGQQLLSSFEDNLSSTVGATWEGPGISQYGIRFCWRDGRHVCAGGPSFAHLGRQQPRPDRTRGRNATSPGGGKSRLPAL